MKIVEIRGMLATRLVWPSKWVGRAMRANRMHRKSSWRTSKINFGILDVGIRITQKMVCYSTWKSSKWGVCSLRGLFDLPNGSEKPWWPTVCIDNVLTDVHEKIWHFWNRNPDHPKKLCVIAHENHRNEAYARFGARFTFQMGRKICDGQPYA